MSELWDVKVDRVSPLGNPFYMKDESQRDKVCDEYEEWFCKVVEDTNNEPVQTMLWHMVDKYKRHGKLNLFCWCAPKRCHSETIKRYIETKIKETE